MTGMPMQWHIVWALVWINMASQHHGRSHPQLHLHWTNTSIPSYLEYSLTQELHLQGNSSVHSCVLALLLPLVGPRTYLLCDLHQQSQAQVCLELESLVHRVPATLDTWCFQLARRVSWVHWETTEGKGQTEDQATWVPTTLGPATQLSTSAT